MNPSLHWGNERIIRGFHFLGSFRGSGNAQNLAYWTTIIPIGIMYSGLCWISGVNSISFSKEYYYMQVVGG